MNKIWIVSFCVPVRFAPPEHVLLHGKSLSNKMARASGGANNMHPLSLGRDTNGKDIKVYIVYRQRNLNELWNFCDVSREFTYPLLCLCINITSGNSILTIQRIWIALVRFFKIPFWGDNSSKCFLKWSEKMLFKRIFTFWEPAFLFTCGNLISVSVAFLLLICANTFEKQFARSNNAWFLWLLRTPKRKTNSF